MNEVNTAARRLEWRLNGMFLFKCPRLTFTDEVVATENVRVLWPSEWYSYSVIKKRT